MVSECIQRKGRGNGIQGEFKSTALPHFYCLIYASSDHIGRSLVEIQRGNKMFVRIQGLHAALVFIVPNTKGLIVGTTQYKFTSWVKLNTAYPVIMADKCH